MKTALKTVTLFVLVIVTIALTNGCISVDDPPVLTPSPAATDSPTAVPTDWPTQEVATWTPSPPFWSIECLPDGVVPIHPNACPDNYQTLHWTEDTTQRIPELFGLDIDLYTQGVTRVPNADVIAGALRLYTYYFAGEFELFIPGLELVAGHCYTFNVPMALNFNGVSNRDNFSVTSHIYTDRGDVFNLNSFPVVEVVGQTALETGSYPNRLHWEFMPSRDMTIEWSVEYVAQWATAGPGNWVEFGAFYVQDQDNTTLCR